MMNPAALALIQSQTQTSADEFKLLAVARDFITHSKIVDWLKSEFELEHGHATMISHLILPDVIEMSRQKKLVSQLFKGHKADWLPAFYELESKVIRFGKDVQFSPTEENILLKRDNLVFGLIKVTNQQLLIGVNLPGTPFDSTFTSASFWTDIVTHFVTISLQQQINDEVISWLKAGYAKAS